MNQDVTPEAGSRPGYEADADYRLMFGTYDDIITSMWTATTEAAYLGEGCA